MKPPEDSTAGMIPTNPANITPRILDLIAAKVSPEDIAGAIRSMLDATLSNGQPDVRSIESACKLYLGYMVGLPVQRQEIVQHKLVTAKPTAAMLANPETRAMLRRLLDDADKGRATDVESE